MRANNFIKQSLEMANSLSKELENAPKIFENMMSDIIPNVSNEEKQILQSLVKESNKLMKDSKKMSLSDIQQRIDELKNKYERNDNP